MKYALKIYLIVLIAAFGLQGCSNKDSTRSDSHTGHHEHEGRGHDHGHDHHQEGVVVLSTAQVEALGIVMDTLSKRNMGSYVTANGQLEVPPQNEASVTAIIGSNVGSIKVIEGDKVTKGQTLATLHHPTLIELQTDYANNWNQLQFLENEYKRHVDLKGKEAVSTSDFERVRADYFSTKAMTAGDGAQLEMMGLNLQKIRDGYVYRTVPLKSPINGYVRLVNAKTGQYVLPETSLFEVVNIDHIHADLMVFENDVHKVHEGQEIHFTVSSIPDKELHAVIYSVGKAFETEPKAIHIHAEITDKEGFLIPGMYVKGRIMIHEKSVLAVKREALVRQEDQSFVFSAKKAENGEWTFSPVEVIVTETQGDWLAIEPIDALSPKMPIAMNNAFHLMAELKKEEAEHSH